MFWQIFVVIYVCVVTISNTEELSFKEITRPEPLDEYILCRGCGSEIVDSHDLFYKLSPESKSAFNETLFSKERVLIQILSNQAAFDYAVLTSEKASCHGIGEWQWDDSWFPGYTWRPCLCPECGAHIGWVFEPLDTLSQKQFYGLVLSHLIGETHIDSLIKFPKQSN